MLYDKKIQDLRCKLEFFRERLSAKEADIDVGKNLTVGRIGDSVLEFNVILNNLDKVVISRLETFCYWDEIENILVLIVENKMGIDLADRKQYALDIINFGKNEKWLTISNYLISVLSNRCGLSEHFLLNTGNFSIGNVSPELTNIARYP